MSYSTTTLPNITLRIGAEWVETAETDTIRLPYDGTPVATAARGTRELLGRAIAAARAAAPALATLANYERAELLERIAALVRRDAAEFAQLISQETGRPIQEARGEVDRGLSTLAASAAAARDLHGEVVPLEAVAAGAGHLALTVREPVGVIGIITPFNVPFNLALHKLGPALAGGNAVVHKPSEQTPLSAWRLAKAVEEAGAPVGAYNVVTGAGREIGAALVESEGVDMITFTGSIATGEWIRAHAGLKKVTLELGGNSAVILEPDTDLDTAIPRLVQGGYGHSGQLCISVQRVYAHSSIAKSVTERLVAAVEKLKVGHPSEPSTAVSSLISEAAATRVEQWTQDAVERGAKLLTGGVRHGATITPGVLAEVPASARLMQQELFGPLVAVNSYDDLGDAIEAVNATPYGLQAGVFTQHLQRAFATARKLHVGGVLINDVPTFRSDPMPYGGVKRSGIGREGPKYALEEMTEPKLIVWRV
jgi:acyl-CoA reductase-like NAD-dependent aldehyde dehydrogenase